MKRLLSKYDFEIRTMFMITLGGVQGRSVAIHSDALAWSLVAVFAVLAFLWARYAKRTIVAQAQVQILRDVRGWLGRMGA